MSESKKPDLLLKIACTITGADPVLVAECDGVTDRRRVMRHAAALIFTFAVAACLWAGVLSMMLPKWGAVVGGLVVGAVIYLLDLSISTADWDLKGVLAEPLNLSMKSCSRIFGRWVKIIIRLCLALVLAMITGTYVTLFVFKDTIENRLFERRMAFNSPIEAAYQDATQTLRADVMSPALADRKATIDERANLQRRVEESRTTLVEAEQQATVARIEMHRELSGLDGRAKGPGAKYREAELRLMAASSRVERAQQDLDRDLERLEDIEALISGLDARVREAEKHFQERATALKLERDSKLRPEKTDFLMQFEALKEIETEGTGVMFISYLTKSGLVIFEMFFFLVFLNDHASVYTYRLIARTRLEAKRVDMEFARAWQKLDDGSAIDACPSPDTQQRYPQSDPKVESRQVAKESLFDSPPDARSPSSPGHCESAAQCDPGVATESQDETTSQRHLVIGGKPGESVSTKEALADPALYWVNPDRPNEIWDRHHHEQLMSSSYDNAA